MLLNVVLGSRVGIGQHEVLGMHIGGIKRCARNAAIGVLPTPWAFESSTESVTESLPSSANLIADVCYVLVRHAVMQRQHQVVLFDLVHVGERPVADVLLEYRVAVGTVVD